MSKEKKHITEIENARIFDMLLHGDRRSSVMSVMLEEGYAKDELKLAIQGKSEEVKAFKNTDEGITMLVAINKRRIKNGLIAIGIGLLLTIISYLISSSFNGVFYYLFFGSMIWGIVTFIQGIIGLSINMANLKKRTSD